MLIEEKLKKEVTELKGLIKERDKIIDDVMTENKYLKKDRDHYKDLWLKYRAEQDKTYWG